MSLGEIVRVIVDRPLGSFHPEHPTLYYPVNYGYIEGLIAPDGDEQDVYILGVNQSIATFTGKVIAIIHRLDDVEEKWVVAPESSHFSKEMIMAQVDFQEKYFMTTIEM